MALKGFSVTFNEHTATISKRSNGKLIATCTRVGGLYRLNCVNTSVKSANVSPIIAVVNSLISESQIWHERCGHPGVNATQALIKLGVIPMNITAQVSCNSCKINKSKTQPFKESESTIKNLGDLIVSDVKSYPERTHDGFKGFVIFVDVFSGYTVVNLLKSKVEVLSHFKIYCQKFFNKFGHNIKIFRSDNGGKFLSNEFTLYLNEKGIERELTIPYCPSSNGISERCMQTLDQRMMTIKVHSNIPNMLWGELILTSNYYKNNIPTKRLNGETPASLWFGNDYIHKYSIKNVAIGSDAYAHIAGV